MSYHSTSTQLSECVGRRDFSSMLPTWQPSMGVTKIFYGYRVKTQASTKMLCAI